MGKRYIHNPLERAVFVGGVLIPPGEGREVDEEFIAPDEAAPPAELAPGANSLDANLAELVAQPLKDLLPLLGEMGDETLADLARIEADRVHPRSTLLSAIGEMQLERARVRSGSTE